MIKALLQRDRDMADVFLSYTEKDREAVRRLVGALEAVGWSVWWDRRIPAGQTWRNVLERELQQMRCMIVVWSADSVLSEWVCEEAAEGRRLGHLVPVAIARVRPPAGFREIQAADLVDWDGSRDHVGLQRLIEDIERVIGQPAVARRDEADAAALSDAEPSASHAGPGERDPGHDTRGAAAARAGPSLQPWLQRWPWGLALLVALIAAALYASAPWPDRRAAGLEPERTPPTASAAAAPPTATVQPVPPASVAAALPTDARPTPAAPRRGEATASQPGPTTSARRPGTKTAQGSRSVSARCAALLERLALGETLSSASQTTFDQECRQ